MNILMTSDTYLPRLGGGEYHVFYLAKKLREMGHIVDLIVTEKETSETDADHPVHRLAYKGVGSIPSIFWVLWKRSKNVDLIHGHYSYRLSCIAAFVAWLRRIPFVVTQHGLGLLPQVGDTFFQRQVFKFWRWWSMHVAKIIISTSDDLSVDIRALGFGSKIVSITNGYDDQQFTPLPLTNNKDAPVLLAIRRHVPKNGIQYLIRALPELCQQFPNLRCDLIGDGRLQEQLKELASTLGVEKHVRFLGALNHAEVINHYKEATVVVIPSTAESTSLSCIEAMALQRVIVASRVGGLVELIGAHEERGYLVPLTETEHCDYNAPMNIPADRIKKLVDAIAHAITNTEDAHSKAYAATEYAQKFFTWSIIAQRTNAEAYIPLVSSIHS